jgi:hypothetical protein
MNKLLAGFITAILLILISSCVSTVQVVKQGDTLLSDSGYMAIVFSKKVDLISLSLRDVYMEVQQKDTGRNLYIPFGAGGELRLIALAPGSYKIENFVYMSGITSIQGSNSQKPGVLDTRPILNGSTLDKAKFAESLCKEFVVAAGEIVYIGDYSWDSKIDFLGPAVEISFSSQSQAAILDMVRAAHPGLPDSIKVVSLAD